MHQLLAVSSALPTIKQLILVFDTQMTCGGFQHLVGDFLANLLKGRARQFLTQFNISTTISLAQGPADCDFRLAGNGNVQPSRLRNSGLLP